MNELQIFNNLKLGQIRVMEIDGKSYVVGVDVARMLEYANPSKAVLDHCKGISKLGIPSDGGIQETNIIPEGDIYRLIIKAADQSKNPDIREKAEEIEKWIFDEVLPTLRKTGRYEMPQDIKLLTAKVAELQKSAELHSDQIRSGFPDHKADYLTEREAERYFGRPKWWFRSELVFYGYMHETRYWEGKSQGAIAVRLTEKGKEVGEEVLKKGPNINGRKPFFFRWKKGFMLEIDKKAANLRGLDDYDD